MSLFNPCNCPAGNKERGEHHAPDCPSFTGMTAAMAAMLSVSGHKGSKAVTDKPGDYPEDYADGENQYECVCSQCRSSFYGHKRRVICKNCIMTDKPEVRGFEIVGAHDNHRQDHFHLDRNSQSANALAVHWGQRGCRTSVEPLIRLTDHEAAMSTLREDRDQQYDMKVKAREQRDAVTTSRAADKARIAELEAEKARCFIPEGVWHEGCPRHPYGSEWFIAKLDNGQRVVLKELPEEHSYDYRTADETYYSAYRIAAWMQFPDSQYVAALAQQGKEGEK